VGGCVMVCVREREMIHTHTRTQALTHIIWLNGNRGQVREQFAHERL
jgi:hypothetical protein